MVHLQRLTAVSVFCLAFLAGCGGDGKYPVSGVVTWEGEPIPSDHHGYVTLTPVDPSSPPDAGPIGPDGRFSFRATPGEKRVEILITKPVGEVIEAMGAAAHEQYIPTRYNEETELTMTVDAKANEIDFPLVSKKGDKRAGR